jgi:hypothetical protein
MSALVGTLLLGKYGADNLDDYETSVLTGDTEYVIYSSPSLAYSFAVPKNWEIENRVDSIVFSSKSKSFGLAMAKESCFQSKLERDNAMLADINDFSLFSQKGNDKCSNYEGKSNFPKVVYCDLISQNMMVRYVHLVGGDFDVCFAISSNKNFFYPQIIGSGAFEKIIKSIEKNKGLAQKNY